MTELRKFDLQAAKNGAPLITRDGRNARFLAHVPEASEELRVIAYCDGEQAAREYGETGIYMERRICDCDLFMKPLCEVEGKPVYPGDVLYHVKGGKIVAESFDGQYIRDEHDGGWFPEKCSWNKPITKVKKSGWINIYPDLSVSRIHESEDCAISSRYGNSVATVFVEWEEEQK